MSDFKKYFAEFFGTFMIVFFGCGAIAINQEYGGSVTHLGISLTFGSVVCIAINLFSKTSTHFNPAVSFTFFIDKKLSLKHLINYLLFQVCGAISASVFLKILFPTNELLGTTLPNGSVVTSFILEFVLTFFLLILIYFLIHRPTKHGGLIIGFLIFLEAYFAGPYCGASMNPARSIGPAIVSGHLEYLWLYVVAPISGGLSALLCYNLITIKPNH